MNRSIRVMIAMVLGALLAAALLMGAGRLLANPLASSAVPEIVNYQGYLTNSGGDPISGTITLTFRIWDASSGGNEVWNETHNSVPVSGGYFSVFLGSQGNPLTSSVFSSTSRYLEVTYNGTTFDRQRFASVPYALVANRASEAITSTYATTATYALNAPDNGSGGVEWQYVKVVAKSGGDYTSITEAMNAITPSSSERYLILVMPGVYEEQVTVKEYVHLKGAGKNVTYISSAATSGNINDDAAATMLVPPNAQVSHLTVRNVATTSNAVGIKVLNGNENTVLEHIGIDVTGAGGDRHVGLYVNSGNPKLSHGYIKVSGAVLGVGFNRGIYSLASTMTIHDSRVLASGVPASGLHIGGGGPVIQDSHISGLNSANNGKGITTNGSGDNVYIDRSTIEGDLGAQGNSIFSTDNIDFFVGASQLKGAVLVANPNFITCIYAYDEDYIGLNADCQ
jgi:hypothetical protein